MSAIKHLQMNQISALTDPQGFDMLLKDQTKLDQTERSVFVQRPQSTSEW